MSVRMSRKWWRRFGYIGLVGVSTVTLTRLYSRSKDFLEEKDEFRIHTNEQTRKSFLSGMHSPFLTNDTEQWNQLKKFFPQYQFLFGRNLEEIEEKHSLKTPVILTSTRKFAGEKPIDYSVETLCVGGAPALISAVQLIGKNNDLIYLNDERRIPISYGSAWHLEEDAQTEAPTNYRPSAFLWAQLQRLFVGKLSLRGINETGEFPWRTIDWIGWIRHPEHWFRALILSGKYQIFTMFDDRTRLLNDVAKQCFINEDFFDRWNEILGKKLLLDEPGSIIIARNEQEISDLNELKRNLLNEGRDVHLLSKDDFFTRYGFIPNGLLFAEKKHDRVLVANFLEIVKKYLVREGSLVINGTLKEIFVNNETKNGIAIFNDTDGKEKSIQFSRLILSLGNQEIVNEKKQRLFDVIAARGVSMLAMVYLPKSIQLPPVLVCGGTNHATKLNSQPIPFNDQSHLYLMRFTAGACITPNLSDRSTSSYDSTIALGLLRSIEKTLGEQALIKPLFIYGCNRQVSEHGQIKWIEPYENIFIQYGAAGGGLTRAPDFITTLKKNSLFSNK